MLNLILSESQKEEISQWKYNVIDNSITTPLMKPYWEKMQKMFPTYVAPNVITISGLLCLIYVMNLLWDFHDSYPMETELAFVIGILIYANLDSIDGIHARAIKNSSPIGELMDHCCDSIGVIIFGLGFCIVYGVNKPETQWFLVHIICLGFQSFHIIALEKKIVEFGKLASFEAIILYCVLILFKTLNIFTDLTKYTFFDNLVQSFYYVILLATSCYSYNTLSQSYVNTRNGIFIVYGLQLIKIYFLNFSNINRFSIIADGMVMAVTTSDIIVGKMAKKEISPFVVIIAGISQINSLASLIMSLGFLGIMIYEISEYMNLPILKTNTNVYLSGVFDVSCHFGHKRAIMEASKLGNVIVGVINDKDVESYKRTPYMTLEERCREVSQCKGVTKVIPNAELYITAEFIKEHNIHKVICSSEYDKPDDLYYAIPRQMKILHVISYCKEISSSDIISRIEKAYLDKMLKSLCDNCSVQYDESYELEDIIERINYENQKLSLDNLIKTLCHKYQVTCHEYLCLENVVDEIISKKT